MTTENKRIWASVAAVIIVAALAAWYISTRQPEPFPPSAADHISSWALRLPQDIASTSPKITAEITSLRAMLGGGKYTDDDIYIAIGNNQALLGDGRAAYYSYQHAIAASSTNALAYDNLGALFAQLHATSSATRAYAKAVELAPTQLLFQLTYLDYLAQTAPTASSTAAAFARAKAEPGGDQNPNLLIAEAGWLGTIGSTTAAIADWRKLEAIEPASAAAIEARIAALKKQ